MGSPLQFLTSLWTYHSACVAGQLVDSLWRGIPEGVNEGPQLWLEDARTDQRQKLLDISDGVSAGWSPDGTKFYVLDHSSSSSTKSYVYYARSLKRDDLGALIGKSDSSISRFVSGHAYFDFDRWESPER